MGLDPAEVLTMPPLQVFNRLSGGKDKWILDADIKGAFDNISHEYLLKTIGLTPGRELIKQWLKAGYVEMGQIHSTSSGTPQGGTISPLLANIALHGMEEFLSQFIVKTKYCKDSGKKVQGCGLDMALSVTVMTS